MKNWFFLILLLFGTSLSAQDKSVNPGINQSFQNPNVEDFVGRFEREGRDAFDHRHEILKSCRIKPGMVVADIGAGTGLFTRMFAEAVGPNGTVYAVDIAEKFVKHVEQAANGLKNVVGVVCSQDSVRLPPISVDLAFICDTYHHFEFPHKTMRSIHRALKPGGQVVLIDFHRIKGKSSEWAMNHVRAGQEVFVKEILEAGFRHIEEKKDLLDESYFVRFEKAEDEAEKEEPLSPLPESAPAPKDNPTTPEKVALGKQLFFDPRLSGDNTMSCATCHLPEKAFGDGVALGKGEKGNALERNTQSCLNVGFFTNFFWDGRADTLEEQALLPIQSPVEMNQELEELEQELNAIPGYVRQFRAIFGTTPKRGGIARALAAYQRTLVTGPSPFDRFLMGENALSEDAKRGLELFQGEAGCIECHRGPLMTDNKFYRLGVSHGDEGRAKVTSKKEDRYRFRTPSLRNVAETGPYMHNGSLKTLDDVVTFYYRGIPSRGPEGLTIDTIALSGRSFSEVPLIVAFLESLSGEPPESVPPLLPGVLDGEPDTSISPATNDGRFLVHKLKSPYQAGQTEIRVLLPNQMQEGKQYPVIYVLPVEPGGKSRYGDGLLEVKQQDLHNKHQVVFVAPTFSDWPWYADHPTKSEIRQESDLLNAVIPFIEQTYPASKKLKDRLLLGFSKSGWGAWALLLRHPEKFGRAAAWDAPLMMTEIGKYGSGPIFGTQENFKKYRVSDLLRQNAKNLRDNKRLILTGYGNFRGHHEEAHALMRELKIPLEYRDGPKRKHDWHSGWVSEAVELLIDEKKRGA